MAELIEKLRKLEGELREGCWDQDADTCREAAALARRVEDAAVVEVISLMDYNDNTGTMDFDGHIDADPGQRLRLVPEAGQGGGE